MTPLRKVIFWLCVVAPVLMVILVLVGAGGASQVARRNQVQANMTRLAKAIDLYQLEHGAYPSSLERLWSSREASQDLTQILSNRNGDRYIYHPESNGFVISVTPSGWITRPDPIRMEFSHGKMNPDVGHSLR